MSRILTLQSPGGDDPTISPIAEQYLQKFAKWLQINGKTLHDLQADELYHQLLNAAQDGQTPSPENPIQTDTWALEHAFSYVKSMWERPAIPMEKLLPPGIE